MRKDHDAFTEAGATIVVAARHDADKMRAYWTDHKLPYVGVPDPDARLGKLYDQQSKLLKLGLMPALFVIDQSGAIAYAHYSKSMSDIPANATVLAQIRAL